MFTKISEFVAKHYNLKAIEISKLEGYGSENYKIFCDDGTFILKFYDPSDEANLWQILEAETEIQLRLKSRSKGTFPVPHPNSDGNFLWCSQTFNKYYRLLTYVDGELFADAGHTPELFYSFGKYLAEMNSHLIDFRHIATEARIFPWDLQHWRLNQKYSSNIKNPSERKIVDYFFLQTRENVEPRMNDLRKSVIHGDANDWNVTVKDGEIAGIFDFGDICYTPLINELAIVLTYALMGKDDLTEWALPLIKGYHEVLPLEEIEIEVLFYLIATRLCISICNVEKAKTRGLFTEYVETGEKVAWELLKKWITINPLKFENEIRKTLGFELKVFASNEADVAKRNKHTSRALSLQFREPIKMTRAAFQYMFDASGRTYLDCYNNIPQVGHCHPRVVGAGQRAMARLNTNTRYLNDVYNEYAENLLRKFPEKLTKVFFVNSGSAASDLAIRLALTHTNKNGIVVMEHGYHGNTRVGIDISHYKYNRKGGSGKHQTIIEAEIPDEYRSEIAKTGIKYARKAIKSIEQNESPVAAFIAEPIVGCGGQVPLAKDYLKTIYPSIRDQGGVCISDEVQTGFGRLGKFFWGFEMHGVIPDIVVLGKPIGNGHPLGAVVTTDEIAASFETGMEFFSSFGGNPVSCAIGQAVLDVLDEEKLPENAEEVGGYLLKLLKVLVKKYEFCGDARGEGLFLGLELVEDKSSKKPNTKLASFVQNKLKEKNIMVGTDGPFVNVIKVKPPICFTMENAEELATHIEQILKKL
jgi:4-aminobutyrate aminotransferase-like enzyme/Ser/Thr protein kinase RdoA (MazF antagonist)